MATLLDLKTGDRALWLWNIACCRLVLSYLPAQEQPSMTAFTGNRLILERHVQVSKRKGTAQYNYILEKFVHVFTISSSVF